MADITNQPLKTILFLNKKGGVGKTTTTSIVAEYLALVKRLRVLLIDFDGQVNLSETWIGKEQHSDGPSTVKKHPLIDMNDPEDAEDYNNPSAITDIYFGKSVLPYSTFIGPEDQDDTTSPRVDIIAGSMDGMSLIQKTTAINETPVVKDGLGRQKSLAIPTEELIRRIAEFCGDPALSEYYDVVLFDCGPGESALFRGAVHSSTHIVVPYKPEQFSVSGIGQINAIIHEANANRIGRSEPIKLVGLLPSLVDTRNPIHMANIAEATKVAKRFHFPEGIFMPASVVINRRQKPSRPRRPTVFDLKPSEKVRKQATVVCEHIYDSVFKEA